MRFPLIFSEKSYCWIIPVLVITFLYTTSIAQESVQEGGEEETYSISLVQTAEVDKEIQEVGDKKVLTETYTVKEGDRIWQIFRERGLLQKRNLAELLSMLKKHVHTSIKPNIHKLLFKGKFNFTKHFSKKYSYLEKDVISYIYFTLVKMNELLNDSSLSRIEVSIFRQELFCCNILILQRYKFSKTDMSKMDNVEHVGQCKHLKSYPIEEIMSKKW